MIDYLQGVLHWVAQHPMLSLFIVFFCCIAESIVVLGALIMTTPVLMGAGALVAVGALPFSVTVLVAVTGAVIGDSINFWGGRRWGRRALESPFAQRYRQPIEQSRALFERHGAKALVIGRFVGLVRPFVAAFAGASPMSLLRFLIVEVFACLIWAGPLIVAGVVFGASLSLAAEVATRLAIVIVSLIVAFGIVVWAVNGAVNVLQDHARGWLSAVLDWSRHHRQLGRLGGWLADPTQPETPALALLAVVLLGLGWAWLWAWWGHGSSAPGLFDTMAWQGALDLRSPPVTALAIGVEQLSGWQVYGPVAAIVMITLLLQGRTHAAAHWLATVAFGSALSLALYALLKVPDPVGYFAGKVETRFGGGDLVLATVIYGFVPVLLTTHQSQRIRTLYYAGTAVLVLLMLAAKVYLGSAWLSTGLFAVIFGVLWVTVLGIGYRRHGAETIPAREVLPLALGVLIAASALQSSARLERAFEAALPEGHRLTPVAWWSNGHSELPAYRIDASGLERQPMSVQWRGDLDRIDASLRAAGWEAPLPLSWTSSLRWFAVSSPMASLPILPQLHAGRHQALMLRKTIDEDDQWVIRLWTSNWYTGGQTIWIGTLVHQTGRRALGLLRYPRNEHDYTAAMAALATAPAGFEARRVTHARRETDDTVWNGSVWLLRPRVAAPAPTVTMPPGVSPPPPPTPNAAPASAPSP